MNPHSNESVKPGSHTEEIMCPNCSSAQVATVEYGNPFNTYIHNCTTCGYTIMESEWQRYAPQPVLFELHPSATAEVDYATGMVRMGNYQFSIEKLNALCAVANAKV